ncbi:endonuclease [Mycoplasma aquilae ATCC BAA-1896]|uniref:endonuclease n=1 Tax=Mycoplasma aquilae TaxID=1312741 RepID=UPI003A8581A2
MKKIKTFLLSLAGLSIIAMPVVASQCNGETNKKPDGDKTGGTTAPSTQNGGNTSGEGTQAGGKVTPGNQPGANTSGEGTQEGGKTSGAGTVTTPGTQEGGKETPGTQAGGKETPGTQEGEKETPGTQEGGKTSGAGTDTTPETQEGEKTAPVTPGTSTTAVDAALTDAGLKDGNNLFEMIPNAVTQDVINKLQSAKTVSFDYKNKTIALRRKGTGFIKTKDAFNNAKFQLANVNKLTFTTKSGKEYPNGDVACIFDKATNTLTITYKIAVEQADKSFKYSDKTYTSAIKLTVSESAANNNSGDNNTVATGEQVNNLAAIAVPAAQSKYTYRYDNTNDYYAAANGKSGLELLNALLEIQKKHLNGIKPARTGYNYLKTIYDNSDAFKDKYYEKDNSILDIYSENPVGNDPYEYAKYQIEVDENKTDEEGIGMNREHLIPQSWFIGKGANKSETKRLKEENTVRNDAQFVFPTDIYVNKIRGNVAHDDVTSATTTFKQGSKFGTNSLGQPAMEPLDAFKGDIARAYLYFMVTYRDRNIGYSDSVYTDNTVVKLLPHYLNTYLNWDMKDVVDPWDVTRNNEIARMEQMRNPFIDYPDLADSLFGKNPKPFVNKGILVEAILNSNN